MARQSLPWYRKEKACWYVWRNGQRVRLHPEKDEAFRIWHRIEAGIGPASLEGPTVSELIDAYLADMAARSKPSTILSKRKVLVPFQKEHGSKPVSSLTPLFVVGWLNGRRWGQSLRWLAVCILKTCFRWAVKEGTLKANPIQTLKMPPPRSRGAESLVDATSVQKLFDAAPQPIREALEVLHLTGCRPGEVCSVEARHFDADSGVWILSSHKTERFGKSRIVHLPAHVVALCRRLAVEHPVGPLFRNTKGMPLTPDRLRNWMFRTRRRLGLGKIMPYSMRHTFATDCLMKGIPDAVTAELLGHSVEVLHRHYTHLSAKSRMLREAIARVRE